MGAQTSPSPLSSSSTPTCAVFVFQVSLIGISNALGRLSAGWISDRVVAAGLPRSLLLSAMLLTTCGVDFLLAAG